MAGNAALIAKLKAMGLDTAQLEAGDLPSVTELVARNENPFEFVGPNYDPELGRFAQVFTDEDVRAMEAVHYQKVTGVSVRGVPGGHIMLRPAPIEARYSEARKRREQRDMNGTTRDVDVESGAHLERKVTTTTTTRQK